MAATESTFEGMTQVLIGEMGTNLIGKSANLIAAISPMFMAGFGVYILLWVINAYGRGVDENILDFGKRMVGWLVVIALAFNAGNYAKIAILAYGLPEDLVNMMGFTDYRASALDTSFQLLDETVSDFLKQADTEMSGWNLADTAGKYITSRTIAGIIYIFGGTFFAFTLAFYLVAKLSLAMVLVLGPLFIGSMLFPATRQWGMNWIGQILNYAITICFYVILSAIQNKIFVSQMKNMKLAADVNAALMLAPICMLVASTVIFMVVVWNVPSIASALTGGASWSGAAAGRGMSAGISVGKSTVKSIASNPQPKFGGGSGGSIKSR